MEARQGTCLDPGAACAVGLLEEFTIGLLHSLLEPCAMHYGSSKFINKTRTKF
jgi:hypothetical protein